MMQTSDWFDFLHLTSANQITESNCSQNLPVLHIVLKKHYLIYLRLKKFSCDNF